MKFAPHALVQKTYLEFPYKYWHISPSDKNAAILSITGQFNEVKIIIKEGVCQLAGPLAEHHECLQGWFAPSMLFKRMSLVGLNFVGPKSMNNVDVGDWIIKVKLCIPYLSILVLRWAQ
jgi:hypothetical protein